MSAAERALELHLKALGIEAVREYRFAVAACGGAGFGIRIRLNEMGLKDWRADFAIPEHKLLIEIEGGGWTGGRHTRGKGFEDDLQKYDAAMRLGYMVYRCSPAMVSSGKAIETIMKILGSAPRACADEPEQQ